MPGYYIKLVRRNNDKWDKNSKVVTAGKHMYKNTTMTHTQQRRKEKKEKDWKNLGESNIGPF